MYVRRARSIFAERERISIYLNIFFFVLFRSHFTCEYRLPIGKYRAVRHIDCAFGANIDLLIVPSSTVAATTVPRSSAEPPPFRHAKGVPPFPLSGKSTPQSLPINGMRGKVGMGGKPTRRSRATRLISAVCLSNEKESPSR